jgi:hypothetical protein
MSTAYQDAMATESEQFFRDNPQFAMSQEQANMLEVLKKRINLTRRIKSYTVIELEGGDGCFIVKFDLEMGGNTTYVISKDGRKAFSFSVLLFQKR